MPRRSQRNNGFFDTIEYVGPRPQKPKKKRRFFGGWVIILIAVGIPFLFFRKLVPTLKAEQEGTSLESVERTIARLTPSESFGDRLAASALGQARTPGVYDNSEFKISYPGGDVPAGKGNAEDVIVRAYRGVNIDLQQLVHEDMEKSYREYEQLSKAGGLNTNVDHRRAPNLKRFFERHGETLTTSRNISEYQPGDVVVLTRPGTSTRGGDAHTQVDMHIAMVVPGPGDRGTDSWLVHNLDSGVKWEDVLLNYQIIGHYRYGK
ncbi:DUF1287 domain-containing protein [Luteolibacter ambystomatis]|uniref:DUF1287 domain-containing protein n=1 Tax=Luteolibacter ambystomatis TaxID=2824561 RepID=A0A975G7T5_9BACT|nr:DUF1287 domain-containing protein [Luteolibacter ambystomatis]QUE50330.1 DUF1287 domain-containing protein [Luteolibacter ambystomatis]